MARPKSTVPTPGEIEILQAFWQHGELTGHQVWEHLVKNRPLAVTTVMSMVQIVHDKGWLNLRARHRPFRYEATLSQDGARDMLLDDIKNRLFGGSLKKMVLHVAEGKKVSKQKLQQLEKTLDGLN